MSADSPDATWSMTTSHAALALRARVLKEIRSFMDGQGLLEVQTPLLSRDTVVDRHLEPIEVAAKAIGLHSSERQSYFLQTSPEFAMKRLLASGVSALYQICPAFRASEQGAQHNPEFTMVEWYRVGDDLRGAIAFLAELVRTTLKINQVTIQTYQSAFLKWCQCDPLAAPTDALRSLAVERLGSDPDWSQDRDDWLNLLLAELVQPQLGTAQPLILTHYPASQSALARICPEDRRVCERFELFLDGVELANGYHELVDPAELEQRNASVNLQRQADGHPPLPVDSRLLEAMHAGMPECSGCALGLDRLLMVMSRASHIDQVQAFPIERA